jgi:hypothetical protein
MSHEADTGEGWGDYNARPPAPSNLPPLSPLALAAFGAALAILLGVLVSASFTLARLPETPRLGAESSHAQHDD